jgi:hypothetical protein
MFNYLMSEMMAPFVDIGGIGDNHYLINVRENRRGNQEWTIQRHLQH